MNSLLVNAGIPQLRVQALAGGRFVYGTTIPGQTGVNNYQKVLPRVGVIYLWARFKVQASRRGKAAV